MSLDLVESRVAAGEYKSCAEFDQDMSRLFEKARRWHPVASPSYADILILQVRFSLMPFPASSADVNFVGHSATTKISRPTSPTRRPPRPTFRPSPVDQATLGRPPPPVPPRRSPRSASRPATGPTWTSRPTRATLTPLGTMYTSRMRTSLASRSSGRCSRCSSRPRARTRDS